MQTILPHVDEFRPVHNLDSMESLCRALSGRGKGSLSREPRNWLKRVA